MGSEGKETEEGEEAKEGEIEIFCSTLHLYDHPSKTKPIYTPIPSHRTGPILREAYNVMMKFLFLILLLVANLSAQDKKDFGDLTNRELVAQWVKTERIISQEKTAWEEEKTRISNLLGLYKKEQELLDEEIGSAEGSLGKIDTDSQRYKSELKEYQEIQELLREGITKLLPRARAISRVLPKATLESILPDVDQILAPAAEEMPRKTIKSIISVLNAADKFNRIIHVGEEVYQRKNGERYIVRVIYLGLSRGYFLSNKGKIAGICFPGKNAWQWEERSSLVDEISHAFAVYDKKKSPQLVKLPIAISE